MTRHASRDSGRKSPSTPKTPKTPKTPRTPKTPGGGLTRGGSTDRVISLLKNGATSLAANLKKRSFVLRGGKSKRNLAESPLRRAALPGAMPEKVTPMDMSVDAEDEVEEVPRIMTPK